MGFTFHLKFFSFNRTITISRQWIQFLLIAAVILGTAVISFWGSRNIYIMIVALLVGAGVLIGLIKQPNYGFILILLSAAFMPFSGPSGLNAAMLMVVLMLGLWLMDILVVKRNFVLIRSRLLLPIIFFLVISVIALLMGQIPWFIFARQAPMDSQLGGFSIFIFSIGAMLLAAYLIKDLRWLQIIVWTFIVIGALYVLGRTLQFPLTDLIYQRGFVAGSMFWTWLVALAASQIIYNDQLSRRIKALLIGVVLLTFYVAIVQAYDWKSGWLPPLVALGILIVNRYRKLALLAIPVALFAGSYIVLDLIASDDYSWGTRLDAWKIVLEISRVSPILGMGFSNYYWYTPLFPIRGWRVSFNSHSQYVDLIAQTGYLGLLCFIWLLFETGRLGWGLARKLPNGFAGAYSNGVFAGVIATAVAAFLVDWVLPFVYNIGLTGFRASVLPWIFMGGLVALEQMELQKSKVVKERILDE
jgi:O-antigen ligase